MIIKFCQTNNFRTTVALQKPASFLKGIKTVATISSPGSVHDQLNFFHSATSISAASKQRPTVFSAAIS